MKKLILGLLILLSMVGGLLAQSSDQALFNAVESKNLSRVQNYLYGNANQLFKQGNRHITAFQLAVDMKLYSIADTLIVDGNADVNSDFGVEPPLFIAIRNNDQKMVELLMKHGADPNFTYNGTTAVAFALSSRGTSSSTIFDSLVKFAKQYGNSIDWTWKDSDGRNVLFYAVTGGNFSTGQGGNTSTVKLVMDNAGPSACIESDKNGDTPLHFAVKSGVNEGIIRNLLSNPESTKALRMTNSEGFNPISLYIYQMLNVSAAFSFETLIQLLKNPGFSYDQMNMPISYNMDNGLFIIANQDRVSESQLYQILEIVCKREKKLASLKNNSGSPMLCVAVKEKWSPDVVELLISEYEGDWTKIKDGKNNVIDIMRKNRSEDLYQDIFDSYI